MGGETFPSLFCGFLVWCFVFCLCGLCVVITSSPCAGCVGASPAGWSPSWDGPATGSGSTASRLSRSAARAAVHASTPMGVGCANNCFSAVACWYCREVYVHRHGSICVVLFATSTNSRRKMPPWLCPPTNTFRESWRRGFGGRLISLDRLVDQVGRRAVPIRHVPRPQVVDGERETGRPDQSWRYTRTAP